MSLRHSTVRHSSVAVWQNQVMGNDIIIKKNATPTGTRHIYISTWLKCHKTLDNRSSTSRPVTIILVGDDYWFLTALNIDGTEKWYVELDDSIYGIIVGADGTIYVSTYSSLYALNPEDGSTKWNFQCGATNAPAIGADGTIYIHSLDDYFYAITPEGLLKWRYYVGAGPVFVSYSVISLDGTIYFCTDD